ncbi:MAG: gamma-glutamyltransferase [Candidatus Eremiobacteraeota bacterium]|nr:gamma-glutamyltransferase [Candidatus Eremiobacteraeota bacterium]
MRLTSSILALALVFVGTVPRTAAASTAAGAEGAVSTDQRLATEEGVRVLRAGGNAIDAAVAIGYTLAVTYPAAGNLGGGGFMLVRLANGRAHFIDFRETAPAAATATMYLDAAGNVVPGRSTIGPLSAGVPGSVAGLEYAREHFGTRSRADLMDTAIADAQRGFRLTEADAALLSSNASLLNKFPSSASIFTVGGVPSAPGAVLRQPDLAQTLRSIRSKGADGFYRGTVAQRFVASTRASGGILSAADLAGYRALERTPISCSHRGFTIVTSPLPSSGGIALCEVLGILGDAPSGALRSTRDAHHEIEAERIAFADRNTQEGDPDFIKTPVGRLLNPAYLSAERASVNIDRATPSSSLHPGASASHEGKNTTNYSVIDKDGNAVDVTYTLNNTFGSGFVAGGTGVLLNDEMDDFTSKPGVANMFGLVQGAANAIAPHKRPLSSMSPTIVADASGRAVLAAGAAGGPRIITTTLDIVRDVFDFHEDIGTAIAAPRLHMQWLPDVVYAQPKTFGSATLTALRAMGYHIEIGPADSIANAVAVNARGQRVAAHDPRNATGSALAY